MNTTAMAAVTTYFPLPVTHVPQYNDGIKRLKIMMPGFSRIA